MFCKRPQWLSIFLVFVLLATSNGLAFGASEHVHDKVNSAASSPASDHSHHSMKHASHDQHSSAATSDDPEDCVCDEICCVSYASFDNTDSNNVAVLHDSYSPLASWHYQSISLELYIPPPKA